MAKTTDPMVRLSLKEQDEQSFGFEYPLDFSSIRTKRILAYMVDVVCIFFVGIAAGMAASLLGIITLGLLSPLLAVILACVPLAYHTLTIGSSWNATVGMRMFGIEVSLANGNRPDYMTAFIHAALFYFTMALTSMLVLIVSVFNSEGKLLHDYLTHSIVHNRMKEVEIL